jgi:hypothetical protein
LKEGNSMATLADICTAADLIIMDDDFMCDQVEWEMNYVHLDSLSQDQLILRMGVAEAAIREETNVLNACIVRLQSLAQNQRNI